jgi:ABC-2 type transport system ATP-binding protein
VNAILEVKHLEKKYPKFQLKDVSFTLPAGYICGFIGPNGAGKTTTIKSILGITQPDAGEINLFDGQAQTGDDIGIVMDTPYYVADWTVKEVESNLSLFYSRWKHEVYHRYLARFDLDGKKKIKELSRGMKVKLQLAVALSHEAKLLILDEPTSGLDPIARDEVCDILRDFIQDESHSVLFSTHITSDLEKIADYITFIRNGSILYTGSKDTLMERYVRVTGGVGELTAEQKKLVIGYREHPSGFEGMLEAIYKRKLPRTILTEPVSLEEIVIYQNKEESKHE